MAKSKTSSAQILLFPFGEPARVATPEAATHWEVVLSGTYRKDPGGLKLAYQELQDFGCAVLSPSNVEYAREVDGFVYMRGEERDAPESIELRHLAAIQKANFVWLHAPDGYVGPTAALEVGFARAIGIPVFAKSAVNDSVIQTFVQIVPALKDVVNLLTSGNFPAPNPAVEAFQNYYRRAALQRGYSKESARDTLLLMVEEVGELARAIREREKISRHGKQTLSDPAQELADVFIYVIHMANTLGIDLSSAVQQKELFNLKRLVQK